MQGKKLTAEQKDLIVRVHAHFKAELNGKKKQSDKTLRERVARCLGFGVTTVATVVAAHNKGVDFRAKPPHLTRVSPIIQNFGEEIRRIIRDRNLRGVPVSARHIRFDLQNSTGAVVSVRALRNVVRRLGFRYIRGTTRHLLAESVAVASLRATYLGMKLSNRKEDGKPDRPEVFLDESYVNMNHTVDKAWQIGNGDRHTTSGRGKRIVMVGAGVVRRYKGHLQGKWVAGSFKAWRADLKPRKKKGQSADPYDYHGNFTAPKFEQWFLDLCVELHQSYGPCRVHMDGASYHKRRLNPAPTGANLKAEIQQWLSDKLIAFTPKQTKVQLLEIARANKETPRFATHEIAEVHGHEIIFTPPYHPELQPIEKIWGVMKNRLASQDPAQSMQELLENVDREYHKVKGSDWTGSYVKVQAQEDAFLAVDDDEVVADDDVESSESESESDEDEDDDDQI